MKKFIAALLVIIFAVSVFPVSAAEEFEIADGVLMAYNGNDPEVVIPDGVFRIGDDAFAGNRNIVSVDLADTVYSIGNRAFYGCSGLKSIENTGALTETGAYAFEGAPVSQSEFFILNNILIRYGGNSQNVEIPDGIISVSPYAFANNGSLLSVVIPQSTVSLGEGVFYGCSALSTISVPSSVYYIGPLCFSQSEWIEKQTGDFIVAGDGILIAYKGERASVYLPDEIKQIGGGAFYKCEQVESIFIHEGCFAVQLLAFADCPRLSRVYLPDSIVGIDPSAFENSPLAHISANPQSFGQSFAQKYSIPIDDGPFPHEPGDVNGDFLIDTMDATAVLQWIAGIIKDGDAGYDPSLADVNFDSSVDPVDVTLILQKSAGIIDGF